MKKSELEIGKVYAYARTTSPNSLYQISGFIIDSLEVPRTYRNNPSQEVMGRFTDNNGNPKEDSAPTNINIRKLIGDYKTLYHEIELAEKNREIARLQKSIKTKEIDELIKEHAGLYKRNTSNYYDSEHKTGISQYRLNNRYDGTVNIELNLEQFKRLSLRLGRLEFLEKHYEEQREREEQERLAQQEQTVNA